MEIISFLGRSALLEKDYVIQMHQGLSQGKSFSEMMDSLGFSSAIVTQLSLAEVHGNLHLSLGKIEEYLDNLAKIKKKLIEVATYPLILLGFLLLIMLGLRNYLCPNWTVAISPPKLSAICHKFFWDLCWFALCLYF